MLRYCYFLLMQQQLQLLALFLNLLPFVLLLLFPFKLFNFLFALLNTKQGFFCFLIPTSWIRKEGSSGTVSILNIPRCRRHLPFPRIKINKQLTPLPFPARTTIDKVRKLSMADEKT